MQVDVFPLGPLQTNCYVASESGQAVVVDPGGDPGPVLAFLDARKLALTHILVTHFHFDHMLGVKFLHDSTKAVVKGPAHDAYLLETELGGGGFMDFPEVDRFDYEPVTTGSLILMGLSCRILPTPGHTAGSVSYYFPEAGCVFIGDLLFARSVGRTDFPGGSMEALVDSVRREIFTLPEDTVIYPGHGEPTSVESERLHNPYLRGI